MRGLGLRTPGIGGARPVGSRVEASRAVQVARSWRREGGEDIDDLGPSTSGQHTPSFVVPKNPQLRAAPQRQPKKEKGAPVEPYRKREGDGAGAGSSAASAAHPTALGGGVGAWSTSAPPPGADPETEAGAGGWGDMLLEPETLEEAVRACTSSYELHDVLEAHGISAMAPAELVLCCNQLARVSEQSGSSMKAWTQAQHTPSRSWLALFFALMEPRLLAPECGTGNLVTLIRAVSKLKVQLQVQERVLKSVPGFHQWLGSYLDACMRKMPAFRGDELVRLIASLADMAHQPSAEWMEAYSGALRSRLLSIDPPLLAKGMMAFASLRYEPERALVRAYYTQIYSKLPMFDDRDLATTAQAFTVLKRIIKQEFLSEFLAEVSEKLPTFGPMALANLLTAMAQLAPSQKPLHSNSSPSPSTSSEAGSSEAGGSSDSSEPSAAAAAAAAAAACGDSGASSSSNSSSSGYASSSSSSGSVLRPEQLQHRARYPSRASDALRVRTNARPRTRPFEVSPEWLDGVGERVRSVMGVCTGETLASCMWGLSQLGYVPDAAFMQAIVDTTLPKLHLMRTTTLIRQLSAIAAFAYQPRSGQAKASLAAWYAEFVRLASRRTYNIGQACDVLAALAASPQLSRAVANDFFISQILKATRMHNARNVSPTRVASILRSLQRLRHRPDFGFLHNFTQVARTMWTGFTPQEYADIITALAAFRCPVTVDSLWACEFLALMQCRFDEFPPRAMAQLLRGVVDLPGLYPGAQWVALAVARVQHSADDYTAGQMCDVLVALSQLGYAPPPDVFSSLVAHVTVRADELPPDATASLSGALMQLMPGYIGSGDGHSEYDALQMRLREQQVPARVVLHPVPSNGDGGSSSSSGSDAGQRPRGPRAGQPVYSGPDAKPAPQPQKTAVAAAAVAPSGGAGHEPAPSAAAGKAAPTARRRQLWPVAAAAAAAPAPLAGASPEGQGTQR
ncbi:hypothetical protein FOA52_012913 [Chlamydomonas sp. UWO 241]|nr:hypothetical protein FOA52_012913 [Chlamydomonas sp. UWO 241]